MPDWTDSSGWRDYAEAVRRDLVPQLEQSTYVMSLVPEGEPDIKFAVELGLSIMLDKPIIAVVRPGTRVPAKLVEVADEILEADITTDAGRRDLLPRVKAAMERLPDG